MADATSGDAERFSDLITQKLLKLPQDSHYIELKRCEEIKIPKHKQHRIFTELLLQIK